MASQATQNCTCVLDDLRRIGAQSSILDDLWRIGDPVLSGPLIYKKIIFFGKPLRGRLELCSLILSFRKTV
jgi:hypothetical protein